MSRLLHRTRLDARARRRADTRVLIADDDTRDSERVAALIDPAEGLAVVGACSVAAAEATVAAVGPDVVLLDADLRGLDGRRKLKAILATNARARTVVLTGVADPVAVLEALAAGGSGYLLKAAIGQRLVQAIHDVVDGRVPICPDMVGTMRERLLRSATIAVPAGLRAAELTPRELTVLTHVAAGLTNEQVAEKLVLSPGTVKQHVQNIIAKLGVANRTQAAVYAARRGLLSSG